MTTSFTQTRNELIFDAFQIVGVYGIGRTMSDEDVTFASNMLNKMVKAWGTKGLHLWAKEEAVLFISPNTPSYLLGSTAKATKLSDLVETQLNGDHVAADTTLVVDSTTGMANSDVIGVVLADKSIHWTTISSVTSSTGITIASGLSGDASDDGLVYTYTSALERPLRVLDARKRTGIGDSIVDLVLTETSYQDYQMYNVKNESGFPSQFHYNPGKSYGTMYLWPCPSDGSERIVFTYERILEDLNEASDTFDFPSEWLEALTWQLAVRLCRAFGKASALNDILPLASQMLKDLLDWDAEVGDIEFMPELRDY
jgi:hypothetical protein